MKSIVDIVAGQRPYLSPGALSLRLRFVHDFCPIALDHKLIRHSFAEPFAEFVHHQD